MKRLIYISTATRPMSGDDIMDLLNVARSKNLENSITGMLLYREQHFLQVIEGPEANILELKDKIYSDDRHTDVMTLSFDSIKEREFAEWEMGFENFEEVKKKNPEGINQFLSEEYSLDSCKHDASITLKLLNRFKTLPKAQL